MKQRFFRLVFISVVLLFGSCSEKAEDGDKILAQINNYQLKLHEYQTLLANEVAFEPDFKVTSQVKETFLEELIRKEVLIQEAKRLKLDRREKFIKAIERYWESTLIRDLMELKSNEIAKVALSTEDEIDERYRELDPIERERDTLEHIRARLAFELKEEKKTRQLKQWMDDLVKKADIRVDKSLL